MFSSAAKARQFNLVLVQATTSVFTSCADNLIWSICRQMRG